MIRLGIPHIFPSPSCYRVISFRVRVTVTVIELGRAAVGLGVGERVRFNTVKSYAEAYNSRGSEFLVIAGEFFLLCRLCLAVSVIKCPQHTLHGLSLWQRGTGQFLSNIKLGCEVWLYFLSRCINVLYIKDYFHRQINPNHRLYCKFSSNFFRRYNIHKLSI